MTLSVRLMCVALLGGALPAWAATDSQVLLRMGSQNIARSELPDDVRQALFDIESEAHEKATGVLKEFGVRLSLARAKNKNAALKALPSVESLLGAAKPSDAEVKAFFEENKPKMPEGMPFEEVKPQISRYLERENASKSFEAALAASEKTKAFEVVLAKPLAPALTLDLSGFPARGPENAKVTLVEVSDYLCSHCRRAQEEVEGLLAAKGTSVRFVQVNFALRPDGLSGHLARGAWCARKQGGDVPFWKYHAAAFKADGTTSTPSKDKETALAVGDAAGLARSSFAACVESTEARAAVDAANERMSLLGVNATPTFFVNGRKETAASFRTAVEEALSSRL
jgi:protein-disulfide isomerase